ncbi:hypothetical protein bcgnr5399_53670 [Bacillus cereus]
MDILRRPAGTMMAALVLSILYGVIRTEKLEIMLDIWHAHQLKNENKMNFRSNKLKNT